MAVTTLLNSINRSTTYPISINAEAKYNCGMLQLMLNGTWSEKMIYELPAINICIYTVDDSKYLTFDINMETVNRELTTLPPTQPYSIAIYNIPTNFKFSITPLFDESALESHNNLLETGVTGVDNYTVWDTFTQTFDIVLAFDDSNIKSGGGGSGSEPQITIDTQVQEGSTNPVQNGAIYNFVNSSVATNTANFVGTYNSLAELEEHQGYPYDITNNDYGFVIATDAQGNTTYNRYKYNSDSSEWQFEYTLNNSSFTAAQWATIQSGFTAADKTKLNGIEAGANKTIIDTQFNNTSSNPVTNSLLTRTMTPMTQSEYDALTNKDLPLYFIYEE